MTSLYPLLRRFWLPLALAGLTLLFMQPVLRPPTGIEALNGGDLVNQQYPLYSLIFDSLRDGNGLPLWNPYQFAGQSIAANPQSTIYYPPAWLMIPLGVPRAVGLLAVLHLWLAGWGMAIFTRRLGASQVGAFIGGLVYEFSALAASHLNAGHLNYLLCIAWLPWVAAAYLWASDRDDWLAASLPGAAAFGLCILTGHPPMLYMGMVWLAGLWLFRVYQPAPDRSPINHMLRTLRPLLVILIFGAILGAVLLLPVGEFTLRSTRSNGDIGFSNSFALPPSHIITLLVPNLFGEPNQGYWGVPFYEELTAYCGILPLIALFRSRRRPAAIFLTALVVLGLVVSLGVEGGLFTILYRVLPGYNLFRVPSRALFFVVIGLSGLTALFITDLQNLDDERRKNLLRPLLIWALPLAAVLLFFAAAGQTILFTALSDTPNPPWRLVGSANMTALAGLAVGATWLVLRLWSQFRPSWAMLFLAAVLLVDLWRVSLPLITVSAVDVPDPWRAVRGSINASPYYRVMTAPNRYNLQAGAAYTHHLNVNGYDPLVSEDYQALLDASRYDPASPVFRLLGVRYLFANNLELSGDEGLTFVTRIRDWLIYRREDALPRVFVATASHLEPDDEAARNLITSGQIDPLTTAVLSQPVACDLHGEPITSLHGFTTYAPNEIEIVIRSDQPGILVLTDSYDPNWTASINDIPVEVFRVDTALRGLCLPAGTHTIRFEYQPLALKIGVIISGLGWPVLGILSLLISLRRFRKRHS